MKKILFILTLMLTSFISVNAQTINDSIQTVQTREVYCEVAGYEKLLSTKLNIVIDYGQANKDKKYAKDDEGKTKTFNSMIDACNYMSENGWTFVNAYPISTGQQHIYHFMFKKVVQVEN